MNEKMTKVCAKSIMTTLKILTVVTGKIVQ